MDALLVVVLFLATLAMGLMSGIMALYANTLMPGLRKLDDRTFVGAFQAIDTRIINPLFLGTFLGALVATGAAALLHLQDGFRNGLPWVLGAFALYLVVVIITLRVNVPLNDGIKGAGRLEEIADHSAVRREFSEERWVRFNTIRAWLTFIAFVCLSWALVLAGRATA